MPARAFLAFAFVAAAHATLVPEMTFREIAADAESIVHGVVTARHSGWDAERAAIWTHYEIDVIETFKGKPGRTLTVSEPGGEADGQRMDVVGAPRYEIGDEVTVFAAPTPIGYRRTCGWGQGKFVVIDAPTPSGRAVQASLPGVELVVEKGARPRQGVLATSLDGLDFAAFKLRLRATVAEVSR